MAASNDARLLELIGDVLGISDLVEVREGLLDALDRAVPSDFVSINEIGPDTADLQSVIRPAVPERLYGVWAAHGHENPLVERFARTRHARAYRFSDVISSRELHALALYREFYAELGSSIRSRSSSMSRRRSTWPSPSAAASATSLRRSVCCSIASEAQLERLVQRGLTAREAAVLGRVACGQSNKLIAADLNVTERTIGKHLQRCYRKLGAMNRAGSRHRVGGRNAMTADVAGAADARLVDGCCHKYRVGGS